MKYRPTGLIYTILADNKPIAAINASGPEAREICKEQWFLDELSLLKHEGEPLYKPGVRMRARPATEEEWTAYDESQAEHDAEDMLFVYLVEIDSSRACQK